jgi:hypothetical protein
VSTARVPTTDPGPPGLRAPAWATRVARSATPVLQYARGLLKHVVACYAQHLAILKIARNYMKDTRCLLVLHREMRSRLACAQYNMAFRFGVRAARSFVLPQEHIQKSNPVMRVTHQCTLWDAVHLSNGHPRWWPPLGNMSDIPDGAAARLAELWRLKCRIKCR